MKPIRNAVYLLGQGIVGIFRNSVMSSASLLILVSCMLVIGTFGMLIDNINREFASLDTLNVFVAYLAPATGDADAESIVKSLNADEHIVETVYKTKDQNLDELKEKMSDNEVLLNYYNSENNPLRASLTVRFDDAESASAILYKLEKFDAVEEVKQNTSLINNIKNVKSALWMVAAWMMGILLLVAFLVIVNTIKLGVYSRRDEISIMRYIGATKTFIILPFIIEGILIGVLSSAIAYGVQYYLCDYVMADIAAGYSIGKLVPFSEYAGVVAAVFLAVGLFAGVVASGISVKKYMKV